MIILIVLKQEHLFIFLFSIGFVLFKRILDISFILIFIFYI